MATARSKFSLCDEFGRHVCHADGLRQDMHQRLVHVFDDAVIVGIDVKVDRCQRRRTTA